MKKKLIFGLCIIQSLYSISETREWDAHLYAKGNKVQYEAALNFLQQNNINITNKQILDCGCGTGDTSATLAQYAAHVHGFDASKNMIDYAFTQYNNIPNLTFEHNSAEKFTSEKLYDLAIGFFCFHWFSDKQQALKQISQSLKENGELFFTVQIKGDPRGRRFDIRTEMVAELYPHLSSSECMQEKLGRSEPTLEEIKIMLNNAGFKIISCDLQTSYVILPDRQAIEDYQRPVIMSRPFIQEMSLEKREEFFSQFIDRIMPTFEKTDNNQFIADVTIRIIHVRKTKK